ncbi:hypothetical protein ACSTAY_01370 [Vreelandella alkaliphila]|uniref:hypothetical protein n=1 Tax=Halomonas sp. GT TaxID=1971364 RepID=UPI0009F20E07|nr:hypothetical protein [Halomonas sp. GT]
MVEVLLTLISRLLNRKPKLDEVIEALGVYQNDRRKLCSQLRLEDAFYNAFKKRASAKLIEKIASINWGPRESLMIFGQAGPAVICDFTTHKMEIKRRVKLPEKWRMVIEFLSGVLFLLVGVTLFFLGTYTLYLLVGHIYFNDIKTLYDTGLKGFALLFQSSLMGFGATIFGAMFTHLGWSLIASLESDTKILELERMLNQTPD